MLSILPKIYRGRHLDSDKIDRYRAHHVAARASDPEETVDLDVDGETPGRLPAYWSIHHDALNLKF
jgi:diacylglycerol kinase family enzyme